MPVLEGKTVIITGAAGNLGQAVAAAFAQAGARRVLVDRSSGRLPSLYAPASADTLLMEGVDLAKEQDAQRLAETALQKFQRIDVLVNAVGGFAGGKPVHEDDAANWERMFRINLTTTLNACRAVIPPMLRQGSGRIVNVAARAGLSGVPTLGAYSASKSAVIRLTESLADELKDHNIGVNCILPGTIDTPQNRADMPSADFSKWVAPAAIAEVILFLASDAARAVTGAAVPVYGRS
ncbi:MAG: SDR family NAD(P)-dependent oxidoreductase [Gammaproteobacteria bacterium]|nr:SDR family NAD(P)-dependent oxidoreductase [Gammaproteobacteria bacterium]